MNHTLKITIGKNKFTLPYFNPKHHIFDLVLIIYSNFFLYNLFSKGGYLHRSFGPWTLVVLCGFSSFFIIWYLGIIMGSIGKTTKRNTVLVPLGFAVLYIAGSLQGSLFFNLRNIFEDERSRSIALMGFGIFFTAGMGYGLIMAITEMSDRKGPAFLLERISLLKEGIIYLGLPFMILYLFLALYFKPVMGKSSRLFAMGVAGGLAGGLYMLLDYSEKKAKNIQKRPCAVRQAFREYCMPVVVCGALCLLEEVYINAKILPALRGGNTVHSCEIILHLFLVGIIPFRILMTIEPPFSVAGFAGGIVSISIFLFNVHGI